MRYKKKTVIKTLILTFTLLALSFVVGAQSSQREVVPRQTFDLGKGMSSINADLMQVAAQSAFFLQFAEQIGLSAEQRKKLEEMYFEVQKYTVRRQADLDIADAELRRLLNGDRVDLVAVRSKVKEIEALQTEGTIKGIESVLRAISTLTHEQHIKVMLLVRQRLQEKPDANQGSLFKDKSFSHAVAK